MKRYLSISLAEPPLLAQPLIRRARHTVLFEFDDFVGNRHTRSEDAVYPHSDRHDGFVGLASIEVIDWSDGRVATTTTSFARQKKWPSIVVIGSSDAKAGSSEIAEDLAGIEVIGSSDAKAGGRSGLASIEVVGSSDAKAGSSTSHEHLGPHQHRGHRLVGRERSA